jgi:3-deoxy-manno-octulosonate cytidylyltransferase (CMP-KDO synthetase)
MAMPKMHGNSEKKFIGIIPARYNSSRLPGKALKDIGGKSMIKRVWEQASKARLASEIIIATDDDRISEHASSFGARVIMTAKLHQSGTDRCAEAARKINAEPNDLIINIQGDEPFLSAAHLDQLAKCFTDKNVNIATLAIPIKSVSKITNPNTPKVVRDLNENALLFSRSPIPHLRESPKEEWLNDFQYLKHIGIYAFRNSTLQEVANLSPSPLEKAERLEQLRWMENGLSIKVLLTLIDTITVDTAEDLEAAILRAKAE